MDDTAKKPNILIYIVRHDLRLSDNLVFDAISKTFSSQSQFTHLLVVYVFAAQRIEVSGFVKESKASPYREAKSEIGGFWRCGPPRVKFLAESIWDLKGSLEHSGNGLEIRVGSPADVVKDTLKYLKEKKVEVHGVWMTGGVVPEELQEECKVKIVVEEHGREFRLFQDEKYLVDEYDDILHLAS
jgi:deoxyribodipyrimidine photo-lyase